MNDARVHQLLAKAGEVEAFEAEVLRSFDRDVSRHVAGLSRGSNPAALEPSQAATSPRGPRLVAVGNDDRASRFRRFMPALIGLTGIAAAVGLAFVSVRPTVTPDPRLSPSQAAKELPPFIIEFLRSVEAANVRTERDILLAVYEPADPGQSPVVLDSCLQVWEPSWTAERDVADAPVAALVGESLDHACLDRPGRVTIVGLTGPADRLPQTQSQAMDLVACMLDRGADPAHQCGPDDLRLSSAAAQCVPDAVSVRVQTVSFGR